MGFAKLRKLPVLELDELDNVQRFGVNHRYAVAKCLQVICAYWFTDLERRLPPVD
jgi:hypothetical protein